MMFRDTYTDFSFNEIKSENFKVWITNNKDLQRSMSTNSTVQLMVKLDSMKELQLINKTLSCHVPRLILRLMSGELLLNGSLH